MYDQPPRSFELANAGLYSLKDLLALDHEKYREFVLKLFECRDERHQLGGITFDGYLRSEHVLVFDHENLGAYWGYEYIDALHEAVSDYVRGSVFIITPASAVSFLEDYVVREGRYGEVIYKPLRVPLDLLRSKEYASAAQPISDKEINFIIDGEGGFGFQHIPSVSCRYLRGTQEGNEKCLIRIERFKSHNLTEAQDTQENLKSLAMVLVDSDYDGETFSVEHAFYSQDDDESKKGGRQEAAEDEVLALRSSPAKSDSACIEFSFPLPAMPDAQIAIIYIDTHGNEKFEIKPLAAFKPARRGNS